ncbi:MAG: TonB-dependent receptor [Erythrobacter sp. RIFCSPHIGHO2_12_FULL_63_10]|nr:MAG: TonB-dependent receptor [Erythrobacter sp. RIFCSPHIGHO2_12_FULL_63_10]
MTDRLLAIVLPALLSLPAPLMAQDADTDAPEPDPVIVVTGRGLAPPPSESAYSVTVLERDRIVAAPSGRIEEVLGEVAGFQQFRRSDSRSSNPTAQGVTLRALGGNASSRALVLFDGVPMADPFFGHIPLSMIAPERLASIRVTRGGGSGPFGAGALAGTIELDSADADTLGLASGGLMLNQRGESEASAALAPRLGSGFAVASGRWDRGRGFHTTPEDQRVPASVRASFDGWSVGTRMVAPLGETVELQARMLAFAEDRTLRFAGADSHHEGQDASLRLVGRGEWQFDALAYVQARNFSNVVISSTRFTPVLDQRNTPATGLGGKFELRPPVGGDHTLRLGADYRRSTGELQEEAFNAVSRLLTERRRAGGTNGDLGIYAEDDWRIGALMLTAGIRADRTSVTDGFFRAVDAAGNPVSEIRAPDRSDWALSWRTGLAYDAGESVSLRAAAYTGLRQPTLNELYRPFVVFPVETRANAALRNERLEGVEAGIDVVAAEGVKFSLTLFDNRLRHAIANVTLAPNLRERQNLPAIKATGAEAGLSANLGAFRLTGSLAYTDARIEGSGPSEALDGNRPPQVPRWSAATSLAWTPTEEFELSVSLRHVGKQFEDDLESDPLAPATTIGTFARVALGGALNLVLRVENVLDEEVVTRNSGGSIDLGTPRTVWAGLRYGF